MYMYKNICVIMCKYNWHDKKHTIYLYTIVYRKTARCYENWYLSIHDQIKKKKNINNNDINIGNNDVITVSYKYAMII